MEKREDTLKEALQKNEEEKQRWEKYFKEQETTIENLETFSKKLSVDIMVPIGRKAFMPGRLIHTNEVTVGHYQDYFSKCSAYTATEILKKRMEKAKHHLEELENERELFENKLEKPYLDGVLPNTEEREIIEEYDEEKEQIWRKVHKEKVKKAKLREKQERENIEAQNAPDDEILQKLEEQDIMDELNEELNDLDIETNRNTEDLVSKLMSGELNIESSKKRIAHNRTDNRENSVIENHVNPATKVNELKSYTNHSSDCKQVEKPVTKSINGENSDDDSDTNTQSEIRLIQEQAVYLPEDERAGFFQYEMRIIDGKIASIPSNDEDSIKEKMRLLSIRYSLEELIELHEEVPEIDSDVIEVDKDECIDVKPEKQQKRRISFALEDQTLEFRKNETVAQMMPAKNETEEKPQRDIIRLDEPMLGTSTNISTDTCKRKTIAEKVEENLRTQTSSNGYLVNQIIDSTMSQSNTLRISFKHSTQLPQLVSRSKLNDPQSPAELYALYCGSQSDLEVPKVEEANMNEKSRENAFVDVRSEFMSPLSNENIPPEMLSKSILKNKSAVDREHHIEENKAKTDKQKKNKRKPKEDSDCLSAYNKVMGEVLENNLVQQPDPLPKEKFIDMHTPKKRISRFKQMRQETQ